jgi:hypothetical protein
MRVLTTVLLLLTLTASANATDPAPQTEPKGKAKAHATAEKRRDLERRIEALERKYEMQYRETDAPNGAPGATAPAEKPAAD